MTTRRAIFAVSVALAAVVIFSPLAAALVAGVHDPSFAASPIVSPLLRSSLIALFAAVFAVAVGMPFAWLVDRARRPIRVACWAAALLALIVPPYVVAESAIVLFGPAGKVSRGVALLCGLGPPASDVVGRARFAVPGFVFTAPAAGVVIGAGLFPIVAFAAAAAMRRTDRRTFDAARLMRGRSGVLRVASAALVPPTIGAALIVFAIAFAESVVPQLLRQPAAGEAINERAQSGDVAAAARLGAAAMPPVLLAGAAGAWLIARARSASVASLEGDVPRFDAPTTPRFADAGAVIAMVAATAVGLLAPAIAMGWLVATAAVPVGGRASIETSGFWAAIGRAASLVRDDALRTASLAIGTATLAVVLAVGVARPLSRTRRGGAWLGLFGAGLAVPAPIVGLGLTTLWNGTFGNAIYGSVAVVALAWLARFLPVAILLVYAALTRVPPELEDAAALAGRGPVGRFVSVVLPAAAPGFAAAWAAVYVLSATESVATLLVSPPGAPFLAPSVINLVRRGQDPAIAACQAILLAVVITPLSLLTGGLAVARRARR